MAAFQPGAYQIAFLDIYMSTLTGIDAARRIYREDPDCRLVFFTTSEAHAATGYEVQARFYLQKPLSLPKLNQALALCCKGLSEDSRLLETRVNGISVQIPRRGILYLDCVGRVPHLYLADRTLTLSESLSAVQGHLEKDRQFYSCNRGLWVNLAHVTAVEHNSFLLRSGERLPIRQKGLNAAKKAYLDYSLSQLCGEALP